MADKMSDKDCKSCEHAFILNSGRRYSLAKIITGTFTAIVALFLIMLVLVSYRLNSFHYLLANITDNSFPEMTYSTNLHNEANELLYFSSSLINTNTDVGLRSIKKEIDSKIDSIKKQIIAKNSNLNQLAQLQLISHEITNLSDLVIKKRDIQKRIITLQNKLYSLQEEVFKLAHQINKQENNTSSSADWTLIYSEIISLTSKGLIKQRLQEVRQAFSITDKKMALLDKAIISLPENNKESAILLTKQLHQLLLADSGLLFLKIESLRIAGRVTGRGNFVKNLIDDFLRGTEFKSYQINKTVIDDTLAISKNSETESTLISLVSILVLFLLFFAIAFIEKRFVGRIITLNKNMLLRLNGCETKLNIKGNDEIADMANTFDFFAEQIEEQKQKLHDLSLTDSLTGLANRRALDQRLLHDLQIAIRSDWSVAVMLMDIDSFKKYNDTYGHVAGDACLQMVSDGLSRCQKRSTDFVARYGGEEFLFLLPDTGLAGAQRVADKIIAEMSALNIEHKASDVMPYVTLSIGITIFNSRDKLDCKALLENVDHALYKAKLNGKNCSCFYQP